MRLITDFWVSILNSQHNWANNTVSWLQWIFYDDGEVQKEKLPKNVLVKLDKLCFFKGFIALNWRRKPEESKLTWLKSNNRLFKRCCWHYICARRLCCNAHRMQKRGLSRNHAVNWDKVYKRLFDEIETSPFGGGTADSWQLDHSESMVER